jgi:cell fate regulator YaaT (PSP1 superfamily)
MTDIENKNQKEPTPPAAPAPEDTYLYQVQFRENEQISSASSKINNLTAGELVMIKTDHGLEPATIIKNKPTCLRKLHPEITATHLLLRRCNFEEIKKFKRLLGREQEDHIICQDRIKKYKLLMKLIKVERFFNSSKIIFYFTAENRVDFRELVKDLVQEFRTRVEMRQVGVRHETKIIGGMGYCGRELCCSSFLKNFAPVSIKMAKEQELPLNPTKISGICNRLLCCLTYESATYQKIRKELPRYGNILNYNGVDYRVCGSSVLQETIKLVATEDPDNKLTLEKEEWKKAKKKDKPKTK